MNASLQAMVSEYAMITFATSIENEGDGSMTLKVDPGELSKLIEKDMCCRLELPDRSSRQVRIRDIARNDSGLFLECCLTGQGGNA